MAMAKYLAVTEFDCKEELRMHMVSEYQGSRNDVLTYYRNYNNNRMVTIPATVAIMECENMDKVDAVLRDEKVVELISLNGNGWQSVIYCEASIITIIASQ